MEEVRLTYAPRVIRCHDLKHVEVVPVHNQQLGRLKYIGSNVLLWLLCTQLVKLNDKAVTRSRACFWRVFIDLISVNTN